VPRRKGKARDGAATRVPTGRPACVVVLPSRTEFLGLVREVARQTARLGGFAPLQCDEIGLAVDECATNVIKHAYRGAEDGRVELHLEHRGSELVVEVLDSGAPVDPNAMPRVDLERYAAERRKGGFGVYLMGRIMDSVSFERCARRNVCRLVKRKAAGG
jgi:anti-sigma regulatory factor (Ser/Thr protein kinase)